MALVWGIGAVSSCRWESKYKFDIQQCLLKWWDHPLFDELYFAFLDLCVQGQFCILLVTICEAEGFTD